MARRIEIELTSARDDGTWTWRAAGAKQPKGTLDAALLQPGAKVGDVLRVEADFDVDGIVVTVVLPPKSPRSEPERLEIIGPPREQASVTSSLAPKRERDDHRRDRRPDGDRRRRAPERDRPPRRDRAERAERSDRPRRDQDLRSERKPRPAAEPASVTPARPRARRLQPKRVHRDAVLASLAPEHRPVAEQVLRGGLPAVRQAVNEQNERARRAGGPLIKADALLALAEELLPRLRAAEWLDRAEAALAHVDEIAVRDLRAIVTGSEGVARDDASRALAASLRDALQRRSEEERSAWLREIEQSLDDGRVVRALRTSSRPPEPGITFPAELAARLSDAAGTAMNADVADDRWAAVLDAVVSSPVRKSVRPEALPAGAGEALVAAARRAAPRVPALGALLGIERPVVGASAGKVPPPVRSSSAPG
jgi:hypothetical protein